jgi:hypothetical protein
VTAVPLFHRPLRGGGDLTIVQDDQVSERRYVEGPSLIVYMQTHPAVIGGAISRDDVQELVQALDDWLYDSRPS